jgi:hypothetical protein
VLPPTVCVETTRPSTESWNVRDVPVDPATAMPTLVVPLTVAPAAGLVKDAVIVVGDGLGEATPLRVVIVTEAAPVFAAESVTVATSVCAPSATTFVSYGIDTGPRLAVVIEPIGRPPRLSEYVLRVLVLFSSHITAHAVPLTVVEGFGCVTASFSVPLVGGGVVVLLATVTVRVAEPVRPAESRTVAVSTTDPFGAVVVFHEKLGPVPLTAVLPACSVYV